MNATEFDVYLTESHYVRISIDNNNPTEITREVIEEKASIPSLSRHLSIVGSKNGSVMTYNLDSFDLILLTGQQLTLDGETIDIPDPARINAHRPLGNLWWYFRHVVTKSLTDPQKYELVTLTQPIQWLELAPYRDCPDDISHRLCSMARAVESWRIFTTAIIDGLSNIQSRSPWGSMRKIQSQLLEINGDLNCKNVVGADRKGLVSTLKTSRNQVSEVTFLQSGITEISKNSAQAPFDIDVVYTINEHSASATKSKRSTATQMQPGPQLVPQQSRKPNTQKVVILPVRDFVKSPAQRSDVTPKDNPAVEIGKQRDHVHQIGYASQTIAADQVDNPDPQLNTADSLIETLSSHVLFSNRSAKINALLYNILMEMNQILQSITGRNKNVDDIQLKFFIVAHGLIQSIEFDESILNITMFVQLFNNYKTVLNTLTADATKIETLYENHQDEIQASRKQFETQILKQIDLLLKDLQQKHIQPEIDQKRLKVLKSDQDSYKSAMQKLQEAKQAYAAIEARKSQSLTAIDKSQDLSANNARQVEDILESLPSLPDPVNTDIMSSLTKLLLDWNQLVESLPKQEKEALVLALQSLFETFQKTKAQLANSELLKDYIARLNSLLLQLQRSTESFKPSKGTQKLIFRWVRDDCNQCFVQSSALQNDLIQKTSKLYDVDINKAETESDFIKALMWNPSHRSAFYYLNSQNYFVFRDQVAYTTCYPFATPPMVCTDSVVDTVGNFINQRNDVDIKRQRVKFDYPKILRRTASISTGKSLTDDFFLFKTAEVLSTTFYRSNIGGQNSGIPSMQKVVSEFAIDTNSSDHCQGVIAMSANKNETIQNARGLIHSSNLPESFQRQKIFLEHADLSNTAFPVLNLDGFIPFVRDSFWIRCREQYNRQTRMLLFVEEIRYNKVRLIESMTEIQEFLCDDKMQVALDTPQAVNSEDGSSSSVISAKSLRKVRNAIREKSSIESQRRDPKRRYSRGNYIDRIFDAIDVLSEFVQRNRTKTLPIEGIVLRGQIQQQKAYNSVVSDIHGLFYIVLVMSKYIAVNQESDELMKLFCQGYVTFKSIQNDLSKTDSKLNMFKALRTQVDALKNTATDNRQQQGYRQMLLDFERGELPMFFETQLVQIMDLYLRRIKSIYEPIVDGYVMPPIAISIQEVLLGKRKDVLAFDLSQTADNQRALRKMFADVETIENYTIKENVRLPSAVQQKTNPTPNLQTSPLRFLELLRDNNQQSGVSASEAFKLCKWGTANMLQQLFILSATLKRLDNLFESLKLQEKQYYVKLLRGNSEDMSGFNKAVSERIRQEDSCLTMITEQLDSFKLTNLPMEGAEWRQLKFCLPNPLELVEEVRKPERSHWQSANISVMGVPWPFQSGFSLTADTNEKLSLIACALRIQIRRFYYEYVTEANTFKTKRETHNLAIVIYKSKLMLSTRTNEFMPNETTAVNNVDLDIEEKCRSMLEDISDFQTPENTIAYLNQFSRDVEGFKYVLNFKTVAPDTWNRFKQIYGSNGDLLPEIYSDIEKFKFRIRDRDVVLDDFGTTATFRAVSTQTKIKYSWKHPRDDPSRRSLAMQMHKPRTRQELAGFVGQHLFFRYRSILSSDKPCWHRSLETPQEIQSANDGNVLTVYNCKKETVRDGMLNRVLARMDCNYSFMTAVSDRDRPFQKVSDLSRAEQFILSLRFKNPDNLLPVVNARITVEPSVQVLRLSLGTTESAPYANATVEPAKLDQTLASLVAKPALVFVGYQILPTNVGKTNNAVNGRWRFRQKHDGNNTLSETKRPLFLVFYSENLCGQRTLLEWSRCAMLSAQQNVDRSGGGALGLADMLLSTRIRLVVMTMPTPAWPSAKISGGVPRSQSYLLFEPEFELPCDDHFTKQSSLLAALQYVDPPTAPYNAWVRGGLRGLFHPPDASAAGYPDPRSLCKALTSEGADAFSLLPQLPKIDTTKADWVDSVVEALQRKLLIVPGSDTTCLRMLSLSSGLPVTKLSEASVIQCCSASLLEQLRKADGTNFFAKPVQREGVWLMRCGERKLDPLVPMMQLSLASLSGDNLLRHLWTAFGAVYPDQSPVDRATYSLVGQQQYSTRVENDGCAAAVDFLRGLLESADPRDLQPDWAKLRYQSERTSVKIRRNADDLTMIADKFVNLRFFIRAAKLSAETQVDTIENELSVEQVLQLLWQTQPFGSKKSFDFYNPLPQPVAGMDSESFPEARPTWLKNSIGEVQADLSSDATRVGSSYLVAQAPDAEQLLSFDRETTAALLSVVSASKNLTMRQNSAPPQLPEFAAEVDTRGMLSILEQETDEFLGQLRIEPLLDLQPLDPSHARASWARVDARWSNDSALRKIRDSVNQATLYGCEQPYSRFVAEFVLRHRRDQVDAAVRSKNPRVRDLALTFQRRVAELERVPLGTDELVADSYGPFPRVLC